MAQQNTWQLGTLYLPGGPGGFYYLSNGPFSVVLPQVQVQANSDLFTTEAFTQLTGQFIGFCSHSFNSVTVQTDWDYDTNQTVALLLCPICSAILRVISPASDALGGNAGSLQNAILFP
jgi:hypothetical protein